MNKYEHIDGTEFKTEEALIKHIRALDSEQCKGLSDDFIYTEAYQLGEFKIIEHEYGMDPTRRV